jgi:hypothetical protein
MGNTTIAGAGWFGAAVIAAVLLGVALQVYRERQYRQMFEAALAANQPEVARELIRNSRFRTTSAGLALTGAGLGILLAMAWSPALSILAAPGAAIVGIGVPLAAYGLLCQRAEGQAVRRQAWWAPIGVVVLALPLSAVLVWVCLGRSQGPRLEDLMGFRRTVESVIGAPIGTIEVTIDGHRAHGILTGGGALGQQACGSPYDSRLRFETPGPGFLNVYYIPDLDQYRIFGAARVTPSGKVIRNGTISTREALGSAAPAR